jgi:electron transfer flavoprotein beta subunit
MEIVVLVKEVLDPNVDPSWLSVEESGVELSAPVGVPLVTNGYDENAVEAALRLQERFGGTVTAISMGSNSAQSVLRAALAMGVDEVKLLEDDARPRIYDPVRTATALATAIRSVGAVDVVVCGRQASDTDGGQVPAMIAALLDFALVSPVTFIEEEGDQVVVRRPLADGYQRLEITTPAVLAVSSEANEPRFPKMRSAAKAKKAFISGDPAEADTGAPRVELVGLRVPELAGHAEMLGGGDGAAAGVALADRLHEMGLIR